MVQVLCVNETLWVPSECFQVCTVKALKKPTCSRKSRLLYVFFLVYSPNLSRNWAPGSRMTGPHITNRFRIQVKLSVPSPHPIMKKKKAKTKPGTLSLPIMALGYSEVFCSQLCTFGKYIQGTGCCWQSQRCIGRPG